VDWFDATDSYTSTINITQYVKSIPLFTDTGTGEVNEATIILNALNGRFLTAPGWVTSTSYFVGDMVKESSKFYLCLVAHTSGTFSTDLAAAKWSQLPDLDIHDRFRIRCTDVASNTYDRYFEVMNYVPSQTKGEGTIVTITLLGIEYHTQQIHMARPYYFEDAFTVANDIGIFYNDNKGTDQPDLNNSNSFFTLGNDFGNEAPFFTANNYEYAVSEDRCYNRWMDVIEKLGGSVSSGGALVFYELSFDTTAVNAMNFKLRKTGSNTSGIVTIQNSKITNPKTVGEQEGELLNPTGSNVCAWGSPDHGSLPVGFSKYDSNLMFFIFRPEWSTAAEEYKVDARVKVTTAGISKHYKANTTHAPGATFAGDIANWDQIDQAEEFGNTEQYSPWTDDKSTVMGNSGADPERNNMSTGGWFDMNVVINDNLIWFRTWVDARASTNAQLDVLVDNGANNEGWSYQIGDRERFPNGFRVLVHQDASGDLAGLDDQIAEYRRTGPTSYSWQTLYDFGTAADANVKVQVAVIGEGKIYEGAAFNGDPTWTAKDTADYANDCFHPYTTAPAESDGVDFVTINNVAAQRADITDNTNRPDITKAGGTFSKNKKSAIKFISVSAGVVALPTTWALTDDWFKQGIGFNIRFPYPVNNFNAISERVGELYGGGFQKSGSGNTAWTGSTSYSRGDKVIEGASPTNWYVCLIAHTSGTFSTDLTAKKWRSYFPEPSVMNIQNMGISSNGLEGFNWGGSSEDLGPINAVAFWLKLSRLSATIEWDGEHPFRCWFCDTKDNVVYQDFKLDHSNTWEDVRLPISGFRPYKAIKPLSGFDAAVSVFVQPNDVEVFNIFEWRNIKLGGVQYQGFYDEHGRFNPGKAVIDADTPNVTWAPILGETSTLELDGFRFIKPLLTTSGQESTRNIEPDFLQRPNITLYHQLQNDVKSQLEIEKFKHKAFTAETSGDHVFDIRFGESFYLFNSDLISDADNGINTIKLVAKRIEYSITKPEAGRGGLRRRIMGSKVFT